LKSALQTFAIANIGDRDTAQEVGTNSMDMALEETETLNYVGHIR